MSSIQLSFSIRTSSNVKSVHLTASWDNYASQLPLSQDPSKKGQWKGTFRFQSSVLNSGSRYWFYYILDGYHVSHDPARDSVVEPTTGRTLNFLDVPAAKASSKTQTSLSSKRNSRRMSVEVPKGRALSPSKIQSPKPMKPYETRQISQDKYSQAEVDALSHRLSHAQIESSDEDSDYSDSDGASDVPSLTSRSSNSSSPSSVSSTSSCCTCERYGITRAGNRVKLDCGGQRCGYSDGSECSSEDDEDYAARATRRQGIVVRG